MNRRIHVAWGVSIFAIFCLLIFQGFWLNRVIELKKIEYLNLVNSTLSGAVESSFEEYIVRNQSKLEDPVIISVNSGESLVKFVSRGDTTILNYEQDYGYLSVLRKVCYDLIKEQSEENVFMLDSVCKAIFASKGINEKYVLELVNTKTGDIIASTDTGFSRIKRRLVSNMIELGLKSHHGVIVYFDMPYKTFFTQMTGVLISSFVLFVLLIVCFIYQIKTILVQYQISKIREEFMSSMVHELKLPLSAVQNAFSGIISYSVDNLKDKQRILLNAAHKRVDQLNNFVYKLLIVWKQGFKISWNRLNLRETIDSLVALFDPMLMGKNVSIKVDYQLSVDVIEADDIHFPNAINNLIENAIKYSGDPAKVEVMCREVDGMIAIDVKDNGIGIPEKFREKIFERYYRIHHGRSTDVHGFGIGLSYVKQVVEAHEGVIRVESEVGVGTTFTVMIPLVKDEND